MYSISPDDLGALFIKGLKKSMICLSFNSLIYPCSTSLNYSVTIKQLTNCNKFYCNLTFYKLNTYLILTSACLVLWSKNVSTDKNFF